jgi:hypothetical protein
VYVESRHGNGNGDCIGITLPGIIYIESQNILTSQNKIV